MSLIQTALITFGFYLLLTKLILPYFEKRDFNGTFPEMKKLAWLTGMNYVKKFAFLATVTYLGLWLVLQTVSLLGRIFQSSEWMLSGLSNILVGLNGAVHLLDSNKAVIFSFLLSGIFLLLIIRKNREKARKIHEELINDFKNGKLDFIEPNENMVTTREAHDRLLEQYKAIESLNPNELSELDNHKRIAILSSIEKAIPAYREEYNQLDIRRRILPKMAGFSTTNSEDTVENGEEKSWKEKIFTFFTSQGLVNAISKTSGGVANFGIAFLLLSFLSAKAESLSTSITQSGNRLAEIDLAAKRQNVKDLIKTNISPTPQQEWKEDDEEALNGIARQFELQMANALSPSVAAVNVKASFNLKAEAVKGRILKTYAYNGNGTIREGFEVVERGAKAVYDAKEAKFVDETYRKTAFGNEPQTEMGKRYRESFRENVKKSSASKWANIKNQYHTTVKSFSTVAEPRQVVGMFFEESFKGVFDWTMPDGGGVVGEVGEKMGKKVSSEMMKNVVEYRMDKFTADLFNGEPLEKALISVGKAESSAEKFVHYAINDLDFPSVDIVSEKLKNYDAGLQHNTLDETQLAKSRTAVNDYAKAASYNPKTTNNRAVRVSADAVTDFNYHFPVQAGMQNETIAANALDDVADIVKESSSFGGGGSGGSSHRSSSSSHSYRSSSTGSSLPASRARSFGGLRGFRRIGGVLIGQNPKNGQEVQADFVDISWAEVPTGLEVFLHRADGVRLSIGVYEKDIINQALAYVSDGRLISATMISAAPIPYFKILVHPALINTDLGCQVIGLDRLVDKYAREEAQIAKALKSVQLQNFLYKYACIRSFKNSLHTSSVDETAQLEQILESYDSKLSIQWGEIYATLDGGAVLADADKSFMIGKSQYFDQDIVQALSEAIKNSNRSFEKFKEAYDSHNVSVTDLARVLKVETEEWSGVREMGYSVDANLSFLRPTDSQNTQLFPLEFMRQVIYNPTNENGDAAEQADENPWEFPLLKSKGVIGKMVWKGINSNAIDRKLFERMKAFTLAQRSFRCLINGTLGYRFPVEKLTVLAQQTRPYVSEIKTPTWNYNRGIDALFMSIMSEQEKKAYGELIKAQEVGAAHNVKPCN
jgi:hypothetical protein